MYFLTLKGKEKEGAFAIINSDDEKVLLFFEEHDDAERYRILLDEDEYPEMEIMEYDDEFVIKTLQITGHNYTIIKPHDLVVPPDTFA
jgi:hypothetical protein